MTLPQDFLDRMKGLLGEEYETFLASLEEEKYQALRINPLKARAVAARWEESGKDAAKKCTVRIPWDLRPVPWAEYGYYYEDDIHPGKHPYHEAGVYYIQEPSAMAPVTLLDVQPGQRVLDLCAAPGGKSTQIAGALQGEGLLVCNEIHPARAKILSENIERLGVRNACVTNETPQKLAEIFVEYFDCILVDAPCSGEGMFRKNEEACEEWSPENVEICAARQDEILDCAAKMLRPGGKLVYSTCTFAPAENEGSISRFVNRHPEFRILPVNNVKQKLYSSQKTEEMAENGRIQEAVCRDCDGRPDWVNNPAEGIADTMRLWPHHIKGEGHYAALLQKAGTDSYDEQEEFFEENRHTVLSAGGLEKGIGVKELGEFPKFVKGQLKMHGEAVKGKYLKFGDNIYFAPEDMPALKGLKVLRPGLHLGTLKKNRFEPSHALALAMSPEEAVHVWNLSAGSPETAAYLNGQTFPAEGEKGWYLICVDGYSLGWGKLAGGIMKNHYPKGLRKP